MMLEAFRELVDRHRDRVYGFAYHHLGSREEAEDVTQEVLLRLWKHMDRVEPERAGAWLARVTRNACYDLLRGRRSRRRVFVEGGDAETREEWMASAPDTAPAPDAGVATWDVARHLKKALGELDEPYRSIVILREIQGLKYDEISAALEMPLNTVKAYLHRARRRLRSSLEEVHDYAH